MSQASNQGPSDANDPGQRCFINEMLTIDLLGELFIRITATDNMLSTYPFIIPRRTRAPMLLTFVCSYWRKVALSIPNLWSNISVDMEQLLIREGKRRQLYRLWFDRSWGCPVSISILDVRSSRQKELDTSDWLDLLLEEVPRLKFVSTGPNVANSLIQSMASKPAGCGNHLEGLVTFFNENSPCKDGGLGQIPTLFPNLAQLDLTAHSYTGLKSLNLERLTHLSCNIRLFVELFSQPGSTILHFPNLLELYVHEVSSDMIDAPSTPSLDPHLHQMDLPNLRYLRVNDTEPNAPSFRAILPMCNCPRLEVLHVDHIYTGGFFVPPTSTINVSNDFGFIINFLNQAPCLRRLIAKHGYFFTTAFLKHPEIQRLPYVQVTTPSSQAYPTVEAAREKVGKAWKAEGLDVVFLASGDEYLNQIHVGFSRIASAPLGSTPPIARSWSPPFWDQTPYFQHLRGTRGLVLVPC